VIDPDILMPSNGFIELFKATNGISGNVAFPSGIGTILFKMDYFSQDCYMIYRQERLLTYRNIKDSEIIELVKNKADLIEVEACSSACMMIRRDVLEAVPNLRYFEGQAFGHDTTFCIDARLKGFNIHCSLKAEALHLQPVQTYRDLVETNIVDMYLS
jgi:GT2 family glycosyltransferase